MTNRKLLQPLVLTLVLSTFACLGNMDGKCDEKYVREFPAPGGKLKAVEYHSVCEGNVFVATVNVAGGAAGARAPAMHAQLVSHAVPPAWPELKIDWKSDRELWITY